MSLYPSMNALQRRLRVARLRSPIHDWSGDSWNNQHPAEESDRDLDTTDARKNQNFWLAFAKRWFSDLYRDFCGPDWIPFHACFRRNFQGNLLNIPKTKATRIILPLKRYYVYIHSRCNLNTFMGFFFKSMLLIFTLIRKNGNKLCKLFGYKNLIKDRILQYIC